MKKLVLDLTSKSQIYDKKKEKSPLNFLKSAVIDTSNSL
jgi:hypothetical protein